MSVFRKLTRKARKLNQKSAEHHHDPRQHRLVPAAPAEEPPAELDERLAWFRQRLAHCSDAVYHVFVAGPHIKCALVYIRGMVDRKMIQDDVLKTIASLDPSLDSAAFSDFIFGQSRLPLDDTNVIRSAAEALVGILAGNAVLLVDGEDDMLELAVAKFEKRAVEEAPNEIVIRGPREAFIENFEVNITLIRKRLQSAKLKTEAMHIGTETRTTVVLAYLEGICKQELLDEIRRRLSAINIDGVLATAYIEEFIEDNPFSPFPQLQYTERPDVVVASLLEGRAAIVMDGTPTVMIAPVTFLMLLQTAEDYYERYIPSTFIRWIRYTFLFVSLLLPSVYIAITTIHPEIIPDKLLKTIAASREVVPFPALAEAFIMEVLFEALREAAIRIPKSMGQAVSIIGALIIGTAAVQAGIASAVMVIIVSMTGISSFIIPHFDLGLAFRMLRFPIMIMAGTFGLFGIACALILIYLHLVELRSFGTPYLAPVTPIRFRDFKDILYRGPWWMMKSRPGNGPDRRRQSAAERQWAKPPEGEED